MRECIICGRQMSDDATTCGTCGFSSRRRFLSRTHYQSWVEQTVIPYREKWERGTAVSVSKFASAKMHKSAEPFSQERMKNHPGKRRTKLVFRGMILAVITVAILTIFIEITIGKKKIETLDPQEQVNIAVDFITEIPNPSKKSSTLKWIEQNDLSFQKYDEDEYDKDSGDYVLEPNQLGKWHAYYRCSFTLEWLLTLYVDDPVEYYEKLQDCFEKAGFLREEGGYITSNHRSSSYYSEANDIEIELDCDIPLENIEIRLKSYDWLYQV